MLGDLVAEVTRYTDAQPGASPFATAIDGLTILRANQERLPAHLIFKPSLCLVVQGAKWAIFGDKRYDYRAGQALVVSVELPALGRVAEASPAEPGRALSGYHHRARPRRHPGRAGRPAGATRTDQ